MFWNYPKTQCYFRYWRKLVKNVLLLFPFLSPCERFLVEKTALGHVFLEVLLFFPVSIIPPMLQTHLRLSTALNRTDKREKPGNVKNNALFFPT